MVAYSNAYQLWKHGRSERSLPFVDFIETVLCNIIDEGGQETVSEDEEVEMVEKVVLAPTKLSRKEWAKTKSRLTGKHCPVADSEVYAGKDARRLCLYCKLLRCSVKCFQCNFFLHIGSGFPNCFSKWHSEAHLCDIKNI